MPDSKITALTSISTSTDPANDPLVIVDLSDTSMAATGTTKKVTLNQLLATSPTATLASATISGDLTVDTNVLKVDTTNNRVGIGTASPANQLSVRNEGASGIAVIDVRGGSAGAGVVQISGNATTLGTTSFNLIQNSAGAFINQQDANPLSMFVNGSERYAISSSGVATWSNVGGVAGTAMTLNANGLGVGVTPSAWSAGGYMQLPSSRAFAFAGAFGDYISNGYYDGSWKYTTTAAVSRYRQDSGSHQWLTAPSGTAGNTITFTQAMTLTAAGNLLVARTGAGLDNTSGVTIAQSSIGMQTEGNATQIAMNRTTSDGTIVDIRRNNSTVGTIAVTTAGTTYNTTSDYRLKEAVQPLAGGLARVNALKPSIYKWKLNGSSGEGFIAHELAEVVPAAVTGEKDAVNEDGTVNPQGVDLSKVVPVLVAAIQELTARVQTLEAK